MMYDDLDDFVYSTNGRHHDVPEQAQSNRHIDYEQKVPKVSFQKYLKYFVCDKQVTKVNHDDQPFLKWSLNMSGIM